MPLPAQESSTALAQARAMRPQLLGRIAQISERRGWAYYLLAPSLLLILIVIIYPIASGIALSFFDLRLNRPDRGMPFVGLRHYGELLGDRTFRTAITNTAVWVIAGVSSQLLVGLITALALNRALAGFRLARVLILMPWVLPPTVAAYMWALMLDSRLGVLNDLLVRGGLLSAYHAWFADPRTALPAVLTVALWQSFPFFTLMLLAGLQTIPQELYESAGVDGASAWAQFRRITLPLLTPVIVATVVLRVIGLVNSPDLLVVLTGGGPGHATQILSLYAFQTAYVDFDFGYAAALSVVMMLILMLFTTVYVRVSGLTKE
jgi:multiple sugar transport system permease protein